MKVKDIYNAINEFAPYKNAEKWDNCGILVGNPDKEISKVLLCLDVTYEVINEAEKIGAELILSHHPIIFNPLKNVLANSIVYQLIKKDISVISSHTNLDISPEGVNLALANAAGLKNLRPLTTIKNINYNTINVFVPKESCEKVKEAVFLAGAGEYDNYKNCAFSTTGKGQFLPLENSNPYLGQKNEVSYADEEEITFICPSSKLNKVISAMLDAHPYETPAYNIFENKALSEKVYIGLIGECDEMTGKELALILKKNLQSDSVKIVNADKKVKTVGLCSGSGADFISDALAKGADAFITGDVKHNILVDALNNGLVLIDGGHFATENIVLPQFKKSLEKRCKNIEFVIAETSHDPAQYI